MINNRLEKLKYPFNIKVKIFLTMVKKKYPNVAPYETLRTPSRQKWLVAMGKSWTLNSKHLTGQAVDWVFLNSKWQPTRKWNYQYLHYIGVMCGITPIYKNKKLIESCHLQDNNKTIKQTMETNSKRYESSKHSREQKLLHNVNVEFRKYIT